MTLWGSVMSGSPQIKGKTTDEAFWEQSFLWENGASVGSDFEIKHSSSFTQVSFKYI